MYVRRSAILRLGENEGSTSTCKLHILLDQSSVRTFSGLIYIKRIYIHVCITGQLLIPPC